jgi:hypothetical protein
LLIKNIVKDGCSSIDNLFIINGEFSGFEGLPFVYLRIEIVKRSFFSELVYQAKIICRFLLILNQLNFILQ